MLGCRSLFKTSASKAQHADCDEGSIVLVAMAQWGGAVGGMCARRVCYGVSGCFANGISNVACQLDSRMVV